MEWKVRAIVLGVGMLVLALIGIIVHSDMRLVGADLVGAVAAMILVLLARRGRFAAVAMRIIGAVAFITMALLAVMTHSSPVFTALTLAFGFAFAFTAFTAMSTKRGPQQVVGRPPRTA